MDKNMVKRLDRLMKKYMNKTELDNIAEDELQEVLKKITEMKSKAEAIVDVNN